MKKKNQFLVVTMLIITTFLIVQCQNQSNMVTDINVEIERQGILQTIETFKRFMEDENLDLMPLTFTKENMMCIGTAGEHFNSYSEFEAGAKESFSNYQDGLTEIGPPKNFIVEFFPTGDIAWFAYEFSWTGSIADQPFSVDPVRFSGIVKKVDDRWLIEKLHASIVVPE
jgi:hypothetical protein